MKIKTEELLRLVNIAYKGAGNNKLIPITQMIGVSLKDSKLILSSTDSFNYLYIRSKVEQTDEIINVCVNAEIFNKLINKFDCDYTTLEFKDNYLLVVGNGEYKLDLLLDDEGKIFTFPEKFIPENIQFQELELSKFSNIKNYGEKSLAQTMEEPDLVAYFVNKNIAISTDRNVMTVLNDEFTNIPLTLRSKFIDLVVEMKDKIKLGTWINNTTNEINVIVYDGETVIFSKVNGNVNDYPFEAIKNLIDTSTFTFNAKVNVKGFLSILDRISLFVTQYDSNVIDLKLLDNRLYISSVKSTGVEILKLNEPSDNINWKGKIDIEMLKDQLNSFTKDEVKIYLGNDNCIKLIEDKVVKLICLVEE